MIGSKKSFLVVATLAVLFAATPAMADYASGSGTVGDPYVWDGTTVATDWTVASGVYVTSSGTTRVNSTTNPELTVQGSWTSTGLFEISSAADGIGTLTVDGGNLAATELRVGRSGGTGYFNVTSGQAIISGGVGIVNDNSQGYMTQTGGLLQINGAYSTSGFAIATNAGNIGTYTISGGTLALVDNDARYGHIKIGNATGTQTSARFEVQGSLAEIRCGNLQLFDTLAFAFDDNGVSFITTKRLHLNSNSVIDLSALAGANVAAGTYDLIKFEGSIYAGSFDDITLVAPQGWSLQLDGSTIQAVIPEPATMGLLGLGLAGILARRRRR